MSSKEGYDVLRLIEHGQSCYISSEYVKGCILAVWLRYHPNLSKDCLLYTSSRKGTGYSVYTEWIFGGLYGRTADAGTEAPL